MNLVPSRNLPGIFYDIDDANRPCYRDGSPVTALLRVPESISHCGICGTPTLEHDDERCRAVIDEKAARAILHNLNALAGQFEAKRLIGIKQLVDELWAQSATWPRTPWWLRMWNRVRSWF